MTIYKSSLAAMTSICLASMSVNSVAQTVDPQVAWKSPSKCAAPPLITEKQKPTWYRNVNSNTMFIFVHGIFSNNQDAWLADNCVYFPKLIADTFPDTSVYLGGFYTSISSGSYDAIDAAGLLFDRLKEAVAGQPQRALDRSQLIFVAHSTGGLVVRQMLASHQAAFKGKKIGLVLLASPTKGSTWADIAKPIANFAGNRLAMQLQTNSDFLKTVDDNFQNFKNERETEGNKIEGIEIVESKFISACWILPCWEWTVVSRESGAVYFPAKVKPNANHFEVAKPVNAEDDSFKWTQALYIDKFQSSASFLDYTSGNLARFAAAYSLNKERLLNTILSPLELNLPDPKYCVARTNLESGEAFPQHICVISLDQDKTSDGYKIVKTELSLEPVDTPRNATEKILNVSSTNATATLVLQPRAIGEVWRFKLLRSAQVVVATDVEEITIPAKEYQIGDEVAITFPDGAQRHRLKGTVAGQKIDIPYGASEGTGWLTWSGDERKAGSYVAKWRLKRPYLN